jgi:hypothetical protein
VALRAHLTVGLPFRSPYATALKLHYAPKPAKKRALSTGEVQWLILPTVSVEAFSMALCHFAKEIGCGKDRHILLVVDKAGWHTGKKVEVPEGIHLEFLPASSPELQPSERLWPLSNEGLANRFFEDIEGLEEAHVGRCVALCDQPEIIRSYTHYHWWPEAA